MNDASSMLILLRIEGLYNPAFEDFKTRVELGAGSSVVSDASRSDRAFDPTLAALAVESASLLCASIALFFQLRDRRKSESNEQLVSKAIVTAEERLQATVTTSDALALRTSLTLTEDRGVIEHDGVRISFVRTESVLEFEADLGIQQRGTSTATGPD